MVETRVFEGPATSLPLWLARLHRSTEVGTRVAVELRLEPDHAMPPLRLLMEGGGFQPVDREGAEQPGVDLADRCGTATRHRSFELERLHTLPDWVGPGMRALMVGLNPSPASADSGVNFARPGNRFWPALRQADLVARDRDPEHALVDRGIGFTDVVKRTTRTAAELSSDDYRSGLDRVDRLASWLAPDLVVVVGLAGWRAARDRKAKAGRQTSDLGGRGVYVMPNTSGLNAHTDLAGFVAHLHDAFDGALGG